MAIVVPGFARRRQLPKSRFLGQHTAGFVRVARDPLGATKIRHADDTATWIASEGGIQPNGEKSELANSRGFASGEIFRRAFVRHLGVTPGK
jgi:hypothetical protein